MHSTPSQPDTSSPDSSSPQEGEAADIEVVRPSQQAGWTRSADRSRRDSTSPHRNSFSHLWDRCKSSLKEWFQALDYRHTGIGLLAFIGFLCWWWVTPILTARTAMQAAVQGQRVEFESHAHRQELLTSFFNSWLDYASTALDPQERTPRAIALSVRGELMERIEKRYIQQFQQASAGKEWALSGIDIEVSLHQRFFAPGREVRIILKAPSGEEQMSWLRLKRRGFHWEVVSVANPIPLLNFILKHQGSS